jgi:hypothetical protein
MKRIVFLLFFAAVFTACTSKIEPADVSKINGYWEIDKVILPNGEEKNYSVNETYDYFEIKGNQGFRKKVTPQFDGTYLVNDLSEKVNIIVQNEKVSLQYTTPYSQWKEELLEILDDKMVLRNAQKNEYHYKKATALNLTGNGKKTP